MIRFWIPMISNKEVISLQWRILYNIWDYPSIAHWTDDVEQDPDTYILKLGINSWIHSYAYDVQFIMQTILFVTSTFLSMGRLFMLNSCDWHSVTDSWDKQWRGDDLNGLWRGHGWMGILTCFHLRVFTAQLDRNKKEALRCQKNLYLFLDLFVLGRKCFQMRKTWIMSYKTWV